MWAGLNSSALIVPLPYVFVNDLGVSVEVHCLVEKVGSKECGDSGTVGAVEPFSIPSTGSKQFRFDPSHGKGRGGLRLYGKDVVEKKSLRVYIGWEVGEEGEGCSFERDDFITIDCIDDVGGKLREEPRCKVIGDRVVFFSVVSNSTQTVVRVRSRVFMNNETFQKLSFGVQNDKASLDIGTVGSSSGGGCSGLSVPMHLLRVYDSLDSGNSQNNAGFALFISPGTPVHSVKETFEGGEGEDVWGAIALPSPASLRQMAIESDVMVMPISCSAINKPGASRGQGAFSCQVSIVVKMFDNECLVDIFVQPRAVLINSLCAKIEVRTPMPYTLSERGGREEEEFVGQTVHVLEVGERVEIFTPSRSIAVSARISEDCVAGGVTDWVEGEWIDIALDGDRARKGSIMGGISGEPEGEEEGEEGGEAEGWRSQFPFFEGGGGNEFVMKEERGGLGLGKGGGMGAVKGFRFVNVNSVNDHTGEVLFCVYAGVPGAPNISPMSAFKRPNELFNRSFLPGADTKIQLVKYGGGGDVVASLPFCVNDLNITSSGGLDSSRIVWENGRVNSGYFAYRELTGEGVGDIVHVIPELKVFNDAGFGCVVSEPGGAEQKFLLEGDDVNMRVGSGRGLVVVIDAEGGRGRAGPVRIDDIGTKIVSLKDEFGNVVGGVRIHTMGGGRFARLVARVTSMGGGDGRMGEITLGELGEAAEDVGGDIMAKDVVRFKVVMRGASITLKDSRKLRLGEEEEDEEEEEGVGGGDAAIDLFALMPPKPPAAKQKKKKAKREGLSYLTVAEVHVGDVTADYRKVFKLSGKEKKLEERNR